MFGSPVPPDFVPDLGIPVWHGVQLAFVQCVPDGSIGEDMTEVTSAGCFFVCGTFFVPLRCGSSFDFGIVARGEDET